MKRSGSIFLITILTFGGYLIYRGMNSIYGTVVVKVLCLIAIAVLFAGLFHKHRTGTFTIEKLISAIIWSGCILRIGYMLITPCTLRGHDLFELTADSTGKAGYLLRLVTEGRLPESYALQLYQQPFFYISGAAASLILNRISGLNDAFSLVDASKTISCLASCYSLFVVEHLLKMHIKGEKAVAWVSLLVAFSPVFILTGGRVGENALCFLFTVLAIIYTEYWDDNPSVKNTVLLAVFYGLGVMTKMSCAVAALYTIFIFARKLFPEFSVSTFRNKRLGAMRMQGKVLLRLLLFGLISLPLGLWYSMRNYLLFGQPLTYVLPQDAGGILFRGEDSLVQRFIIPDIANLLLTPYANPLKDSNLFTYLVKSELFGEFMFDSPQWISILFVFCNLFITGFAVVYGLRRLVCIRNTRPGSSDRKVIVYSVIFSLFAVYSYIKYPFGCTMDCRYYMMLVVCKALIIGVFLESHGKRMEDERSFMQYAIRLGCAMFAILSCMFFACGK